MESPFIEGTRNLSNYGRLIIQTSLLPLKFGGHDGEFGQIDVRSLRESSVSAAAASLSADDLIHAGVF